MRAMFFFPSVAFQKGKAYTEINILLKGMYSKMCEKERRCWEYGFSGICRSN